MKRLGILRRRCDRFRFATLLLLAAVLVPRVPGQEADRKGAQPKATEESFFEDLMVQSSQAREPGEKVRLLRHAEELSKNQAQKVSEIYPSLVSAYVALGDFENAANVIGQMGAQGASPVKLADAQLVLARGYVKARRLEAASEQWKRASAGLDAAIAARSDSPSRLQRSRLSANQLQGELLLEQGDARAALAVLRDCEERGEATKDGPSALMKFDLARAYAALKMTDDARTNFGDAYAQVTHRLAVIREHGEAAGAPALTPYQDELDELQRLLGAIQEQALPVLEAGGSRESAARWLDGRLSQYEVKQLESAMDKASVNKPAPMFALATLAGSRVKLSDLRGKVVLLDFWETSCKPCRAEYPHLKKIQAELRDSGAVVLMVSLDTEVPLVKPFAEKNGFADMVLLQDESVKDKYGVDAMPHNVVIDQAGNIRFSEVGFTLDSPRLFRAEIKTLLGAARSSAPK